MDKIKLTREIGEVSFNFTLNSSDRNLGYIIDTTENKLTTTLDRTNVRYLGNSRLDECKSFDINNPYVVGVNGVTNIKDDIITYKLDDITFKTNIKTNETFCEITTNTDMYVDTVYVREYVGFKNKPLVSDVTINRGNQNIMENFFRLKTVTTLKDFNETGFGFYEVYNQTI